MPKYYGCPCEGCGKPLTLQDDIVVCPDCGAPYHRTCYEKMGLCIHAPAHGAGYEWKFPYQDAQLRTCPTCGERTLRSENVCRCCGAALPPESAEQPNDRAAASAEQNRDFDYSRMYRDEMYRNFTEKVVDPVHRNVRAAFGKDELIDGVPYQDWVDFIGTHGKTTTTSMISEILLAAQTDPTISVGGILSSIHGNLRVGDSEYFISEACEYTNSFLNFRPRYSIILNIEAEHLDFFKDINDIRHSFREYASNTLAGGATIINGEIDRYEEIVAGLPQKIITYGFDSKYDFYPENITYDDKACASFTAMRQGSPLFDVKLSVPGAHNVSNALAAIALSTTLGLDEESILTGLDKFGGADRRFQYKGKVDGVTIIDDYAHHPTEIRATLTAAQKYPHDRLVLCFQPHTYSRTKAFLNDFADVLSMADVVVLADIYAAREQNTYGISSKDILDLLLEKGVNAHYFPSFEEIEKFLSENCVNGDLLITMGAGNVVEIGEDLLKK